jgi:putative (di)nucleoside polyphosphate hydrolase
VSDPEQLPYRRNVGVALFNRAGLVLAGRSRNAGPEIVLPGFDWQMPQGGIDGHEDVVVAAQRELFEETNVQSVELLAVCPHSWAYDFPPYFGPPHHLCAFRGQVQQWVAFRFVGEDSEIDIGKPDGDQPPELSAWAWLPLAELVERVVSYKRAVYERVAEEFGHFSRPTRGDGQR